MKYILTLASAVVAAYLTQDWRGAVAWSIGWYASMLWDALSEVKR